MINVVYNTVGITGVACILFAYFMLLRGKLKSDYFSYLGLNFFGSLCIIFSLIYQWNLSAFVIQASWIAISLYGAWKTLRLRKVNVE
jgi:hypothetical protein